MAYGALLHVGVLLPQSVVGLGALLGHGLLLVLSALLLLQA